MRRVAGCDYLYYPVWCTCTALVCELVLIAYDAYIRFDDGFIVFKEFNGKWGRIDFTGAIS